MASEAWLGIGWAALGVGNAIDDGAYTSVAVSLMVVGTGCLVVGALRWSRRAPASGYAGIGMSVAMAADGVVAVRFPAGIYGSGVALTASRLLTVAAVIVAVAGALMTGRHRGRGGRLFLLIVALAVMSGFLMIKASPRPAIDVWYMYQTASASLLHGHNFYTAHWTSGMPGEVSNQFVYLPASVVVLAPFRWALGDVRFGLVIALALAAFGVFRMTSGPRAWLLAGLVVLVPKLTFGVEQAWNDPLLLAFIIGAVLAVRRGRGTLAVLSFGAALASKQYAWLLVPAAAVWPEFGWRKAMLAAGGAAVFTVPWILASPRAFWQGAFAYNLKLPPRFDSLSLYSLALRRGVTPGYGLLIASTLAAVGLSLWLARHGSCGFVLGAAVVMAGFNLADKQAFFNEWFLVVGLIGVGLALANPDYRPDPHGGYPLHRTRSPGLGAHVSARHEPAVPTGGGG